MDNPNEVADRIIRDYAAHIPAFVRERLRKRIQRDMNEIEFSATRAGLTAGIAKGKEIALSRAKLLGAVPSKILPADLQSP